VNTHLNDNHLVELLKAHGVQPTAQRVEIARLVLGEPRHCSAEQLLEAIRSNGACVSKATVYNTLKLFCERGLLRTIDVDPERQFYDSRTEPHHHFFNVDTGELTDIPPEQVELNVAAALPAGTEQDGVEVLVRVRQQRVGV
jgi:Fur family transcriptional regulator, iron response regulator